MVATISKEKEYYVLATHKIDKEDRRVFRYNAHSIHGAVKAFSGDPEAEMWVYNHALRAEVVDTFPDACLEVMPSLADWGIGTDDEPPVKIESTKNLLVCYEDGSTGTFNNVTNIEERFGQLSFTYNDNITRVTKFQFYEIEELC